VQAGGFIPTISLEQLLDPPSANNFIPDFAPDAAVSIRFIPPLIYGAGRAAAGSNRDAGLKV
jgi:hypothetical protein